MKNPLLHLFSPAEIPFALPIVWRQLLFPVNDNHNSL